MSTATSAETTTSAGESLATSVYRWLGYFGLVSVLGAQLYGFRYDAAAPAVNYVYDLLLYLAYIGVHLAMSRAWFKQAVWGQPASFPLERRVYISVSVITWLMVFICQRPLPGPALDFAGAGLLEFVGCLGFVISVMLFFQGVTFEAIHGLLGLPGAAGSYSHGAETPLFTAGPYAEVRHPMYRAAFLASVASIAIHPNAAQVFWNLLLAGTFIAYIPVEEVQLLAARGDEYRGYQQQTPYRLFRGIW
jgi:protein-S-isoprenylcysteine O-methyltransferase Ste14